MELESPNKPTSEHSSHSTEVQKSPETPLQPPEAIKHPKLPSEVETVASLEEHKGCIEHDEPYIAFCKDEGCKSPICVSCMPNHIGHPLLNHCSLADYIKKVVTTNTVPAINKGIADCTKRIEQVEMLPLKIEVEINALKELTENLHKTTLEQQEKFKESVGVIKEQCEHDATDAKKTKERIETQANKYEAALSEMEKHKANKSFDGVYKKWEELKQLGEIETLSIEASIEERIKILTKKVHKLTEAISEVITTTIKKLNKLPSIEETELSSKVELSAKVPQPIPLISQKHNESLIAPTESIGDHIVCTACGSIKKLKAKLSCGCFACNDCTGDAIIQKFVELFPEIFESPLIECKTCYKDCKISMLKLTLCGCLCNTESLRKKHPFQFNAQRNAFEWPYCYNNVEHKMEMKDILLIWGSEGYIHFDKDLTVDQSLKALAMKHEISFSILTRVLSPEQIVGLSQILKASKKIKHLICAPKTAQGFDKIVQLIEGIKGNSSIQTLIIKQNQIAKNIGALSEVLPMMFHLKALDLSGNELGAEGTLVLIQGILAMKKNCIIKSLNISNNDIGTQGMKYLADALPNIHSLRKLYIDYNRLGMKGAKHLSTGIKDSNIQLLSLNGNGIGAQGVKYLCEIIEKGGVIRELHMQSNDIATEGAKIMAELIEKTELRVLALPQNRIGLDGIRRLAEAIENSSSLQVLSVADNYVGIDGAKALINATKGSENMKIIDLSSNKLSDEDVQDFKVRLSQKGILLKI